jgi:hypothetical protein
LQCGIYIAAPDLVKILVGAEIGVVNSGCTGVGPKENARTMVVALGDASLIDAAWQKG